MVDNKTALRLANEIVDSDLEKIKTKRALLRDSITTASKLDELVMQLAHVGEQLILSGISLEEILPKVEFSSLVKDVLNNPDTYTTMTLTTLVEDSKPDEGSEENGEENTPQDASVESEDSQREDVPAYAY